MDATGKDGEDHVHYICVYTQFRVVIIETMGGQIRIWHFLAGDSVPHSVEAHRNGSLFAVYVHAIRFDSLCSWTCIAKFQVGTDGSQLNKRVCFEQVYMHS